MSDKNENYPQPQAHQWHSQGLTLNYFDWGNPEAPLLILLHGNGDHARSWDQTARALCANWHVVAPDLRGHGDSQWSPDGAYFTAYFTMDIADLLDHLGAEQVTLVAHSFGGVIALRYAAMFPERVERMVIVDGHGPSQAVKQEWDKTGAAQRTRAWIEKRRKLSASPPRRLDSIDQAAERFMQDNTRLSAQQARALAQHAVRPQADGFVWKRDPLVRAFTSEDFTQECAEVWQYVSAPTLFLYATESWKFTADVRQLEDHFPNARGHVFDQAGHWLHHDQFPVFIQVVEDFLA